MAKSYIIGAYNKFDIWDREHSVYKFEINKNWYAIKEVEIEWGLPKLPQYIDRDSEQEARIYHVYDTEADAFKFVQLMKGLN